jgi:glycine/D-amino acid oxidase-like deaminating enzyme
MKQYTMPQRAIPLDDRWDVIVVGGGPAGCTAAAAAAREGARTLLLEATASLGGMGTSGLVPAWCPFSDQEKIIYRGLAEKVFNATKAGMPHVKPDALDWIAIDPELLKRVYDDLVTQAGAQVLFHTTLAAVEMRDAHTVDALITSNKSGLTALRAKVYVDCTGDADLCAWAGAAFEQGDEAHDLMPATHCFILTNVDEYAYRTGPGLNGDHANSPVYAILKSGKYPLIADSHCCNSLIGPGTLGFNAGHMWKVDNTDPACVSRALIQGRKIAAAFRNGLAEFFPAAFGNAFLAATGSLIGIRETRRVIGDYVLTLKDYLERRAFPDEVCRNSYYIDVHPSHTQRTDDPAKLKEWWDKTTIHYGKGESHGVPYRCLTPRDLKNVLVAGRSISCERAVQGSVRVMPVCLAMGEAAGVAAARAQRTAEADVHRVDPAALRTRLRELGCYLP